MSQTPRLAVSVLMRRERVPGPMARWQPWRWVLADVLPAVADAESAGAQPGSGSQAPVPSPARQCVEHSADHSLWLHSGLAVTLHRDDVEGYHLNATAGQPCFWVMWRMEEVDGEDEPVAMPQNVTLSYHDAGRWLDAQETVERVDAPPEVLMWLQAFIDAHYQPEPKRRRRPDSFRPLTDRFGNPVSISTDKTRRGPPADAANAQGKSAQQTEAKPPHGH